MTSQFVLVHDIARRLAKAAIDTAPDGHMVTIREPTRNALQNRTLHGLLSDIVHAKHQWDDEEHDIEFWKGLAVSGWAIATKAQGEVVKGWEGEIVLIRRSTATMTKAELSSLIEYLSAWMVGNGIPIRATLALGDAQP